MRKLIYITILTQLLIAGCTQNKAMDKNRLIQDQTNLITVKQTGENNSQHLPREKIADRLVEIATSIPSVNDATAIVIGDYAVVGIDVDKELDRTRVGSIKYTVAESLLHDPYGANAVVVADADTFERLNKMKEEIKNGRPTQGVMEELAGIIGRIMPQIPSDLYRKPELNLEDNESMGEGDQNQLEQIQYEQSNKKK